jgi:hypothetical protein
MSNIAGKAYAMNVITPIRWYMAWINKLIFRFATKDASSLRGLITLSLIHYARWVIIDRWKFPHLHPSEPKGRPTLFLHAVLQQLQWELGSICGLLYLRHPKRSGLFWKKNVRYPKSAPLTPFHDYIRHNQIDTDHYYNAYPLASSNDVKSAKHLKKKLIDFEGAVRDAGPEEFLKKYHAFLVEVQYDLGDMQPAPIVSMATQAVDARRLLDAQGRR